MDLISFQWLPAAGKRQLWRGKAEWVGMERRTRVLRMAIPIALAVSKFPVFAF